MPTMPDWNTLFPARPAAPPLRIALHAPTPASLERAQSNLRNLLASQPHAEIWIVANAQAVRAAVQAPEALGEQARTRMLLCPNTLQNMGLAPAPGMHVLPQGAVESLVLMQQQGWAYIRC